jgi:hypothetical protein
MEHVVPYKISHTQILTWLYTIWPCNSMCHSKLDFDNKNRKGSDIHYSNNVLKYVFQVELLVQIAEN